MGAPARAGDRPIVCDTSEPETAKEEAMGAVARKAAEALGGRLTAVAERFWLESDAMHALLIKRADELIGSTEASPEEQELRTLADVIDAYEAKRWPNGKMPDGKG
jgi:hypothetical protein